MTRCIQLYSSQSIRSGNLSSNALHRPLRFMPSSYINSTISCSRSPYKRGLKNNYSTVQYSTVHRSRSCGLYAYQSGMLSDCLSVCLRSAVLFRTANARSHRATTLTTRPPPPATATHQGGPASERSNVLFAITRCPEVSTTRAPQPTLSLPVVSLSVLRR